ncbi:hypothetical protein N9N67_05120, partial [Bacteriovoracaceae bacterium]|nr:hypothetical protein [Bacteriovoracaceae bacterium]
MKFTIHFILSIFLFSFHSQSQEFELTEENFCQDWFKIKKEFREESQGTAKLYKQLVWAKFFPGKYFKIKTITGKGNQAHSSTKGVVQAKGLILSLGKAPIDKNKIPNYKKYLEKYDEYNEKFVSILGKRSLKKCRRTKKNLNFNYNIYQSFHSILKEKREIEDWKSYQMVNEQIETYKENSDIDWQIHYVATKGDIRSVLNAGKFQHVVLILHAKRNGTLVDFHNESLPRSLFNHISPNVRSILVMSCFKDKVIKKYKIDKRFFEQNFFGQKRTLIFPVSRFDSIAEFNYLNSLSTILRKTESLVYGPLKTVFQYDQKDNQQCSIEVKNKKVGDLFLDVLIGNQYVGTTNERKVEIYFPCNIVNQEKVNISVRPSLGTKLLSKVDFNLNLKIKQNTL